MTAILERIFLQAREHPPMPRLIHLVNAEARSGPREAAGSYFSLVLPPVDVKERRALKKKAPDFESGAP